MLGTVFANRLFTGSCGLFVDRTWFVDDQEDDAESNFNHEMPDPA